MFYQSRGSLKTSGAGEKKPSSTFLTGAGISMALPASYEVRLAEDLDQSRHQIRLSVQSEAWTHDKRRNVSLG